MKTTFLILLIFVVTSFTSCKKGNYDKPINLDFELIDQTKLPIDWFIGAESSYYKKSIDSNIVFKGKYSLKLESLTDNDKNVGIGGLLYLTNVPPGDTIRLSGFIKTENTSQNSIGFSIGYRNSAGDFHKMLNDSALIGTNDWTEYTIDLAMGNDPHFYAVGVNFYGKGKIWIDNLKLFIDNKLISNIPPPNTYVAGREEINWLNTHSIPIKTEKPNSGSEDLEPLKKFIGDARIVGLGENTHGSSEVFKIKHRLVEFLASELGFTIFSIEADMPEAYKLNDYVLYGKGDPKELLKGLHFWIYNTKEVLDMIEWMRTFNSSGNAKILFTGFDMQHTEGAVENLSAFSQKYDSRLQARIEDLSISLKILRSKGINDPDLKAVQNECEDILAYLVTNKTDILKSISISDYQWLLQNANILLQACTPETRDKSMARNINWILENNSESKIIIWAHNEHISKKNNTMGGYLSEKYLDDYYNVGFLSYQGTYTAKNNEIILSTNILEKPEPGSFEYSFNKTGRSIFYFDFSQIKSEEPASQWLLRSHNCRSIGAIARTNQFFPSDISEDYNAIIFIKSTTETECFNVKQNGL